MYTMYIIIVGYSSSNMKFCTFVLAGNAVKGNEVETNGVVGNRKGAGEDGKRVEWNTTTKIGLDYDHVYICSILRQTIV